MKLSAKILGTMFLKLSVISAFLLWVTRVVDLESQSKYFDQPNLIWYIFLHVGIMLCFWILNSSFKDRSIYGLIAFSSLATLGFDLGDFQILHNITTAILFILACISILLFEPIKKLAITSTSISSIFFLSGLFGWLGPSGIFLGEVIAEVILSIMVLKEIWWNNRLK